MLNKKWFLYVTEFFAGMSVMAIELGASRLLAPYFSSSQIVWTIIIGVIMIAMAVGNIWGGRMADKDPSPDKLYFRLIIVAVWTAAIPFLGKYIIALVSLGLALIVGQNFLIFASLISCLIIFVFPLMLLGTVSPSLVKYSVNSLNENGRTVGDLNALNTIGSIIGTFTPTFITIPTVGTSWTFIIFSAILLTISLIYFVSVRRKLVNSITAALLAMLFAIFGSVNSFAFWRDDITEDESIYNYLQVTEDSGQISLATNVLFGVQSVTLKDRTLTGMYYDYALAAPFMAGIAEQTPADILILGLGTGTYATQCYTYFENANIEGVEIDKKIIDLAYNRFNMPKDNRIKAVEFDGRAYLRTAPKYDVIMVDAYQDITIPFQMSSIEFFTEVKKHLKENGVMIVNLNMNSDTEGSINYYLCDAVSSVFKSVYTADSSGNREVFASNNEEMTETLAENIKLINNENLAAMMKKVNKKLIKYNKGDLILTDDKAPVELLGMNIIDELITDELNYYKDLLKGHSLSEMLRILQ